MDIQAIGQFISSVGFPIACCIFLFRQNSKFQEILNENTQTLKKLWDKMDDISSRISDIEDKTK